MKKILLILCLLFPLFVSAKENDTTLKYNNLYDYNYEIKGDGIYLSNYTTMFYANDKLAYCIEPGVNITTSIYDSKDDFSKTGFTKTQSEYLEMLGYFGYEYPGHKNVKYYLAAQELMWEYIRDVSVRYTTDKNGKGMEIDLSKEKKEILSLIDKYKKSPVFDDVISIGVSEISDKNNVLNDYEILDNKDNIIIKDNKFYVKEAKEKLELKLKYKKYTQETTLVYTKGNSQALATLRLSSDKIINISLTFKGGELKILKSGEKLEENYVYKMSGLKNVIFGIYDLNDNLIKEIKTDEEGVATLNKIPFGTYYVKEIKNDTGHIIDDNKYYFSIDKNNLEKVISLNNYLPKGNVKIIKKGSDGKFLNDVYFDLYKDDIYLGTYKTKDGIILFSNLAYGEYYLKEVKSADGYLIDSDKYYFSLSDEYKEINILNELIIDVPITYKDNILVIIFNYLFETLQTIF